MVNISVQKVLFMKKTPCSSAPNLLLEEILFNIIELHIFSNTLFPEKHSLGLSLTLSLSHVLLCSFTYMHSFFYKSQMGR